MSEVQSNLTKKRRSAVSIMGSLIGLVKPLLHIMIAAIILGTAGYLCAIFLTDSGRAGDRTWNPDRRNGSSNSS